MRHLYSFAIHNRRRLLSIALLPLLLLLPLLAAAQTPHKMADGKYAEMFTGIASWTNDFAAGEGAAPFSKATPSPTLPTQNNVFVSSSSGGVQRGTESIVLLATGSTDGQNAAAFDLSLDFTGTTAGTVNLNWASVNNSTGDRKATFSIQANTGAGGAFEELPGSAVTITNNVLTSGALAQVALPAAFSGKADAKLRFYLVTSAGGTTGSRPKISLDNISVTATVVPTGPGPAVTLSATTVPDFGEVAVGSASSAKTITVSGQNLTGDVTITPAPGFEIRVGDNAFACCAITLSVTDGTLESTAVEVRFAPVAAEAYSANLVVSGGGAASQNIAVTGTGVAPVYPATLSTAAVTAITSNTAVVGGEITSDGGSPVTARGVVWATTLNPTIENAKTEDGIGSGAFTSTITGLTHSTLYYVRAYATNAVGTTYGEEHSFTTETVQLASEPTIASTITISEVTATTLKLTLAGGDGAKRVVLARQGAAVDTTLFDGTTYTANTAFKAGQDLGNGNYVVYKGTGTEVDVTGLRGLNTYHFAVFEYNDNDTEAAENYLTRTIGRASATTLKAADFLALEENFTYTAATLLTDNGWTAHSGTANAIPVAATGLTYSGYASSGIGNSAELKASGQDVNRTFDVINPGTPVYVGVMVNVASANAAGDYFLHLGPSNMGTSIFKTRVYVRAASAGKVQFGVSGSGSPQEYTTQEYDVNTTHLLVVKYTFDETGNKTMLFVNPALNTEPATAQATMEETGDKSPIDINAIALRQGSASPVLTLDGIRVATSYNLVTGVAASKASQQITFAPLADKTFGDAAFELTATSTSALPVTFTVVSGPATLNGTTLTLTGAGQVRVKASQAGNDAFDPAIEVEQAFCVNPATPVIAIADMVLSVTNPTTGVTAYQWYLDGTAIEGATSSSFTATTSGSYTVVAKAGDCASALSAPQALTPTGIKDELLTEGVVVYPNPATTTVNIKADEIGNGTATITLYELTGRQVFTQQVRTNGTLEISLNVQRLQRGMYMLVVSTPKGYITRKIILN